MIKGDLMSNPIRHHHVPQTYLKNFSFKKREQFKIFAMDKFSKKIFEANVDDIAVEKNFYTVKKIEDNYAWENFYAKNIEPMMGITISNMIKVSQNCLIKDRAIILDNEQKSKLAIIMICQLLRGKHSREFERRIFEEKAPQILDEAKRRFMGKGNKEIDSILENYKIDEDMFRVSAMDATLDTERICKLAQVLFNRCWVIYRIIGNSEFVTSDNPLMFMDNQTFDVTPFHNGISNKKTVTFYPISPKLLIATYSYDVYWGILNSYDGRLMFINSEKDMRFINNVNKKQIEQCNRQAFCKTKDIIETLLN